MERKNLIIGLVAISVISVGGTIFLTQNNKSDENKNPTSQTNQTESYKDGSYTGNGSYISPGGREEVMISLVLKDGIIESINFESLAKDPTSKDYQKLFADNFKNRVVGKKITEVKLDKVSGSSLTSGGFNQAIQKIKDQAKNS